MKKFLLATMALALILCFPLNSQAKTKSVKNTTSVSLKTSHTKLNITNHSTKKITISMKGCKAVNNHIICPPLTVQVKNGKFKNYYPEYGTAGMNLSFKKGKKTYPVYVNLKQTKQKKKK